MARSFYLGEQRKEGKKAAGLGLGVSREIPCRYLAISC